jgi:protein KRI1
LLKKTQTTEEKAKEDADYIEWLKGKKKNVKDAEAEKNMKTLHDYWNDPKLSEGEKFLRDYILNKKYLSKEDDDDEDDDDENNDGNSEKEEGKANQIHLKATNKSEAQGVDYVEFSEEEEIIEKQEEFERKYNFRYEEPDPEFIKSYPRTVADSMRRKDTKRKEKREEYKQRKEAEKQKKKEEIKRLKNLKRKEIQNKIEKLKRITGNFDLKLNVEDLDKDFDPDEYENKMQVCF